MESRDFPPLLIMPRDGYLSLEARDRLRKETEACMVTGRPIVLKEPMTFYQMVARRWVPMDADPTMTLTIDAEPVAEPAIIETTAR